MRLEKKLKKLQTVPFTHATLLSFLKGYKNPSKKNLRGFFCALICKIGAKKCKISRNCGNSHKQWNNEQ